MTPEEYTSKVMDMVVGSLEKPKPPCGASIELTITINEDAWAERQSQGCSSSDLETALKNEINYALSHDRDRKLVDGIEDLHVRKYY